MLDNKSTQNEEQKQQKITHTFVLATRRLHLKYSLLFKIRFKKKRFLVQKENEPFSSVHFKRLY